MIYYGIKTSIAVCLGLGLTACTPASPPQAAQPPQAEVKAPNDINSLKVSLQGLVDKYGKEDGFSGTVLIARGDDILVEKSYGLADMAWDIPNAPDMKYRVGSLSKPLLATLIMAMAEDNVLSLRGTLGTYLPDLYSGTDAASVTVEQLLSHTSGLKDIPGNFNDPWYQTIARHSFSPKDFARAWIKPVILEEPGEKWRYNNAGFILLGLIVEAVTGQPYETSLERYVFEPAGMTDSGVFYENMVLPNLAHGYAPKGEGDWQAPLRVDASVFFSAAGIYATARDIHRFDRALYGQDILSGVSRDLMFTRKTDFPYGYGWGVERWTLPDESRLDVMSHTGSIPGYQSYYLRSEGNQGAVIVMNNTNNGSVVRKMGRDLMEVLNGKPIRLDLADFLWPILEGDGEAAMISAYEALGETRYEYELSSRAMNSLGYRALRADYKEAAIAIFEWGTQENPRSANIHDSLGETYRAMGRIDEAVQAYEQALALNPDMPSSLAALKEIGETGQ